MTKTTGAKKRLRLTLLKVGLALTILFVILYNVKVRDHLNLPENVPCTGKHPGWFIKTYDTPGIEKIRFEAKGEFLFEAQRKDDKIISAHLAFLDGRVPYTFSREEMEQIVVRDGLFTVLKTTDLRLWLLAILIYFIALSITTLRWSILLKATELPQSWPRAFKLTFIGFFFNNIMPGQTGGDLSRAYYIARENPKRKTDSIISVFVDRGLGIIALAIIAAVIIPTDFETYGVIAKWIYGLIGIVILGALVFFSKRMRRLFRLKKLLEKLPFQEHLGKLDRSIFLYRYRKGSIFICFVMSFIVHFTIILATWVLGMGIGIDLEIWSYMAYIPIIFIASSLPITPAGWGWGEGLFMLFFGLSNVPVSQALALSLLYRIATALISLLGGVFLLMEKKRYLPREIDMEDLKE